MISVCTSAKDISDDDKSHIPHNIILDNNSFLTLAIKMFSKPIMIILKGMVHYQDEGPDYFS
jgi:hypothetical protein